MMARFEVWQDGICVANAEGPNAQAEGFHYLVQYAQDGEAVLYEVKRGKRIKRASMRIKVGSISIESVLQVKQ